MFNAQCSRWRGLKLADGLEFSPIPIRVRSRLREWITSKNTNKIRRKLGHPTPNQIRNPQSELSNKICQGES